MSRIHPSATMRAKLAVHMYSQKPRPKLISSEAAQKFEAAVLASGMDLTDGTGGWRDELGSRASVDQFIAYWKTTLGDEAQAQELLGVIPALAEEFPTEPEDESQMRREGAEYIEDMKLFKQKLPLSDEPKPLVEWGDLPVSRL
jgi:insulysin